MTPSELQMGLVVREIALKIIADLQQSIRSTSPTSYGPMNNTEQALKSLRYKWEGNHLIIYSTMVGYNYIMTLEHGRGPTKEGATAGNPTLREGLLIWIKSRGIQPVDITQESLAYLMARKIHREGTQVYREYTLKGKGTGILSNIIGNPDYYQKNILRPMREELSRQFTKELQSTWR